MRFPLITLSHHEEVVALLKEQIFELKLLLGTAPRSEAVSSTIELPEFEEAEKVPSKLGEVLAMGRTANQISRAMSMKLARNSHSKSPEAALDEIARIEDEARKQAFAVHN